MIPITVSLIEAGDNQGTEKFMPVLVLAVFSFLLFLAIGALGVFAVISEQRTEKREHNKGSV